MATMRIRSLKPEFFDSPSTASAGPWARILFMGMWCMADDWGVGPANPKELAASIFPNDDQWTSKELPSLCKEVADSYGVVFYTHRGRPYFQIPTWEDHQITQRRAKRRYPTADDPESVLDQASPELPSIRKELPCVDKEKSSSEQGNRGTGEQGSRGASGKPKTPPATRIPDNFTVTPEMKDWATQKVPGLNIEWATEGFIDYWRSATKNAVKKDWPATWRGWMRRNFEDGKLGPQQWQKSLDPLKDW